MKPQALIKGASLPTKPMIDETILMENRPQTPMHDRVHFPADLKSMSDRDLRQLADALRAETISAVTVTGGHRGAGLGAVEIGRAHV